MNEEKIRAYCLLYGHEYHNDSDTKCRACGEARAEVGAQPPADRLDSWMSNQIAYRLGVICSEVGRLGPSQAGDEIDRGLILVRKLKEAGYELRGASSPSTPCPRCFGGGYITIGGQSDAGMTGAQNVTCTVCGGTGRAHTGEGAADDTTESSDYLASGTNVGIQRDPVPGGSSVALVPSGGAPLPKSFHAAWGGPNGHGQVVKLEDALEYAASGGAPAMSAEQFLEEYEGELWIKDYLQKLQVRDFAEAYAASSNAQLAADLAISQANGRVWKNLAQLRESQLHDEYAADKEIQEIAAKNEADRIELEKLVSTLKGELRTEQQAHEAIANYLLPLVGTGDGTSVDAAKKAADEIGRLKGELREARQKLNETL